MHGSQPLSKHPYAEEKTNLGITIQAQGPIHKSRISYSTPRYLGPSVRPIPALQAIFAVRPLPNRPCRVSGLVLCNIVIDFLNLSLLIIVLLVKTSNNRFKSVLFVPLFIGLSLTYPGQSTCRPGRR